MRLILIGTEYVGKTTLANALQEWGLKVGKRFHMDDGDFTIPDYHHLNEEDQHTMWNMSAVLKERFQRMVIYYHLEILERYTTASSAASTLRRRSSARATTTPAPRCPTTDGLNTRCPTTASSSS